MSSGKLLTIIFVVLSRAKFSGPKVRRLVELSGRREEAILLSNIGNVLTDALLPTDRKASKRMRILVSY